MSNGSWRPSTFIVTCLVVGLLYYFWSQTTSIDTQKRYHSNPVSAYDRPGTLSTHSNRLDGNLTGEPVPYWSPFDTGDLSPSHGRLLEKLFLSISSPPERIVDPVPISRIETVLFFGDSNERGIVDELCIKLGRGETWPTVISSKNAPTKSELWHADSHSCEIELKRERKKLRLVSFMNYGVLIEKDSKLWEKKLELDGGPWSIEERIELAKKFVESMGWGQIDLIVFNSNLWDLMYLHDTHLRLKTIYEFSLSSSTLESYISRSVFALSQLAASFPATPLRFRTLHPLHPGRPIDFFNSRRVVQMNEAGLEVVSRANEAIEGERVKLLDVGRVLEGWPTTQGEEFTILKDKVHLDWNPGLWMYGEMVLDALYRASQ